MKILFFLVLSVIAGSVSVAQKKIPLIKANSNKAIIIEGDDDKYKWGIDPAIKPDVHFISKNTTPKWVKFYTDIDSLKVKLQPGKKFDFIVLLNGKDSCYTRLESPAVKNYARQKPATHDTIRFVLTEFNNLKVKAVLNKKDTLDLKFDSGTTGLLLTTDAIKTKTHLSQMETASNTLQLGNLSWDSLRVYPVVLSGQGTDGRFGWDLFDGKVVEIDYDKNIFVVHSKRPPISKAYARFDIEYIHTLFCINGSLQVKHRKYPGRFLFDNGYQRTIMLDTTLVAEQQYPRDLEIIKKVVMKNGQGKEVPVYTVNNERLNLGKNILLNIPVQLMTTANSAGFKTHILGNEVLKRFNTFLDFQNNVVYLAPNGLFNLPYTDAKRDGIQ
jgi:hypothetical protein